MDVTALTYELRVLGEQAAYAGEMGKRIVLMNPPHVLTRKARKVGRRVHVTLDRLYAAPCTPVRDMVCDVVRKSLARRGVIGTVSFVIDSSCGWAVVLEF